MTLKLPRLSSAGLIVGPSGAASVQLVQWWNSVCTAIEGAINTLASHQTQIDTTLGIANSATTSAAVAHTAALYAQQQAALAVPTASLGTFATQNYATPPVIGGTTPNIVNATSLAITGVVGNGFITLPAQSSPPATHPAGNVQLYALTTQGFTRFLQANEAPTALILGRDNSIICKNTSGATINKGQVVNVTGSTGNVPNISLADANSIGSLPAIGVAVDAIANNAFGEVMTVGIVSGFDTSAFTTGAALYLSATVAGAFTQVRPSGTTNFVQAIATVLVSGVGNGSVKIAVAPALLNTETGTNAPVWTAKSVVISPTTFATLPASPVDGQRNFITDGAATTFASAAAGAGTNHVPVYYDGGAAAWKYG